MSAFTISKEPNPSLMAAGGNSGTAHLHNSEHGPFALVGASAASPSAASSRACGTAPRRNGHTSERTGIRRG